MSTIQDIQPIERTEDDAQIRRRTRYTPVPLIKKVGPKTVPPGAMAFIEDSATAPLAGEFVNVRM